MFSQILSTLSNILRNPSKILRAPFNILHTPSNILHTPSNILCTIVPTQYLMEPLPVMLWTPDRHCLCLRVVNCGVEASFLRHGMPLPSEVRCIPGFSTQQST